MSSESYDLFCFIIVACFTDSQTHDGFMQEHSCSSLSLSLSPPPVLSPQPPLFFYGGGA